MNIGTEIMLKRKALGLSQFELSQRAGLKQTTISAIERGVNKPAFDTILLITEALGCTIGELFGQDSGATGEGLTGQEKALLKLFRQLNSDGKLLLISQAEMLAGTPALREEKSVRMAK